MFANKKFILPPKPKSPDIYEILQDLKNSANKDDKMFKLLVYESDYTDTFSSTELNNRNIVFQEIKAYFKVNKKLKILKESIDVKENQLQNNIISIRELTEEIKKQAQAALVQ